MVDCKDLYNDAVSQFESLRLLAECKLSESDANDISSNINSILSDIESRVDDIETKVSDLISIIVSLREQINGI